MIMIMIIVIIIIEEWLDPAESQRSQALNRQKISGGMRAGRMHGDDEAGKCMAVSARSRTGPNRMMMKSGFVAAAVAEAPKGAGSEASPQTSGILHV